MLSDKDVLLLTFGDVISRAVESAIRELMEDAYLAGFFDGEGSVYQNEGRWRVAVVNTDYDILKTFARRFGGSIQPRVKAKPHHKDVWYWSAAGRDARKMAESLLSFLTVKKAILQQALDENFGLKH